MNESESFDFDEVIESYGDGNELTDSDYCGAKDFNNVEEQTIPVIPEAWIIHGVMFPRDEFKWLP